MKTKCPNCGEKFDADEEPEQEAEQGKVGGVFMLFCGIIGWLFAMVIGIVLDFFTR